MQVESGHVTIKLDTEKDLNLFMLVLDNAEIFIEDSFSESSDNGLDPKLLKFIDKMKTAVKKAWGVE